METKFAYSTNEENYHGSYDSPEAAAMSAFESDEDLQEVDVSPCRAPVIVCPSAIDICDHIGCQEDFQIECAEIIEPNGDQQVELEQIIQREVEAWLDRHNLRPEFFICNEPKPYYRKDFWKELGELPTEAAQ